MGEVKKQNDFLSCPGEKKLVSRPGMQRPARSFVSLPMPERHLFHRVYRIGKEV